MLKKTILTQVFVWGMLILSYADNGMRFNKLTSREGLSDMIVQTIYRDSLGYVWFGTLTGIDRFDGIYIKNYPYAPTPEPGKSTYAFVETEEYGFLAGASNGLWQLDRSRDVFVRLFEEKLSLIHALAWNGDELYVGTFNGLYVIREGTARRIPIFPNHDNYQRLNRIEDLVVDDEKGIWAATQAGLVYYHSQADTVQLFESETRAGHRTNHFQSVGRIGDNFYLGTPSHGLICFNRTTTDFSRFIDVGCPSVKDIDTDGQDLIYASTDGNGLQVVSAGQKKIVESIVHDPHNPESISSNSVYCFLKDREGINWLGFYLGGINYTYYSNDLFQTYRFGDKFDSQHYSVRSFWFGENEKFIGTRSGLFTISEEADKVREYLPDELQASIICSVTDYRDKYYAGTFNGGLWVLDPATGHASRLSEDGMLSDNDIYCLAADSVKNLWMAAGNGVFRYHADRDELEFFDKENSPLPHDNAHFIRFDQTGNGWIASREGLSRYNASEKRIESTFPEGFQHDVLYFYIYPDSRGNILFLTFNNIFISNPEMTEFRTLQLDSLIGRYLAVVEDEDGYYWFSTNSGIYRTPDLDPGSDYLFFDYADNLPDLLFNACAMRDSAGTLWFGNSHGLCYVDPRRADSLRYSVHFPIVFSSVWINDELLTEEQSEVLAERNLLRLRQGEHSFSVAPVLLNFANPSSRKYEYRLEGLETDWKIIEDGQRITYTGLHPGTYELIIRARGSDNASSLTIQVRHTAFSFLWSILILATGVLFFFVFRLWLSGRRKRKELRTAETAEPGEKYKNTKRLSEEEAQEIITRLRRCMETERIYLNPALKNADLAARANCSPAVLSQIFSLHLNESYYDFVNIYRIEEFKRKIKEADYNRYTLDALSKECGFNSQASFFRSFKKMTGKTPTEYIQEIRKRDGSDS